MGLIRGFVEGNKMKIALIQMEVIEKNKQQNVQHGLDLLRSVREGTNVAVLPEMWTTGYSIGKLSEQAEYMNGELAQELARIAAQKNMYIVAGSMATYGDNGFYNTTMVFSPQQGLLDTYSKIHLFSLFNEQNMVNAGKERKVLDIAGVSSGLAICYDMRFPELGRAMAQDGAKIVYIPAEWPTVRGYAWELAAKGFALFNQCFVCAVNCAGSFKGQEFYGHSMLVSPWGEVLAMAQGASEEIVYAQVDVDEVDNARSTMSMLKDVRWDLYK